MITHISEAVPAAILIIPLSLKNFTRSVAAITRLFLFFFLPAFQFRSTHDHKLIVLPWRIEEAPMQHNNGEKPTDQSHWLQYSS